MKELYGWQKRQLCESRTVVLPYTGSKHEGKTGTTLDQNLKVHVKVNTHNMAMTKFSVEITTDPNFS